PSRSISPRSLHDALPIFDTCRQRCATARRGKRLAETGARKQRRIQSVRESAQLIQRRRRVILQLVEELLGAVRVCSGRLFDESRDRKSTRLNSSHVKISY